MKESKRKLYISVIIIITIVLFINKDTNIQNTQTVAPSCFEREDCMVFIEEGYCSVEYDCFSGKCYSEQIRCPEVCYGGEDEDLDGFIDCKDSDCFDSKYCPCINIDYGACLKGNCYCAVGTPLWFVESGDGMCRCI